MKYRSLPIWYNFMPLTVESLGALGKEASDFFWNLGHLITSVTNVPRSRQLLMQWLSVAVQHSKKTYNVQRYTLLKS